MTPQPLSDFDEPVRRYLAHALGQAAGAPGGMRLTMSGRIDVGRRLDFTARQEFHGHAFTWEARAGWKRRKPIHVVDRYADGRGSTRAALFGWIPFLRASDEDTARSAAGRAAAESIWMPGTLLGAAWRVEAEDRIVARLDVPPEQPELTLRIGAGGALESVSLSRWGNAGQKAYGYIPFGAHVHAERRFGDFTLPSAVSVGWWFGTSRFKPFFEATVLDAQPLAR